MKLRHQRNIGPLTPGDQAVLGRSRVCVVGCGGIGGHVLELLGRLGVGYITAVDGDSFDVTNLNRQLLSTEETLGCPKAAAAKARMASIDPDILLTAVDAYLTQDNAAQLLAGHDLVIDALDSIPTRLLLQRVCAQLGIPLIHGAVEGWFLQVTTVFPGEDTLSRLYPGAASEPASRIPVLSFVPAFAASVQVSEAVKLLTGKGAPLRGKILFADLLTGHFDILPL